MNQTYLAILGKVVLAAAYLTIVSPMFSAQAAGSLQTTTGQSVESPVNQQILLADNDDDGDDDDDDGDDDDGDDDDDDDDNKRKKRANLPKSVETNVLRDISQDSSVDISGLRVVKAEKITWPNSCLGLQTGKTCSQTLVPGWQVVVRNSTQMWVYRTDYKGEVAIKDEESTRVATTMIARTQSVYSQVSRSTTVQQRETIAVNSRTQATGAATVSTVNSNQVQGATSVATRNTQVSATRVQVKGNQPGFTLGIWQPSGTISEVTARVSIKAKRSKGYAKERFVGDYRYKINQKAKFVKGLKSGDRIVVRLYDTQNRFVGYSEFECLSAHTAVNLILPSNPTESKVVRTVYGIDSNLDGRIDNGKTSYDYFTQVSNQRVTFLDSSRQINARQFQVQGLSAMAANLYPTSFTQGQYSLVRQSINAFSSDLASALKAAPGSMAKVTEVSDNSTHDVSQLIKNYREMGVSNNTQIAFSDVSSTHWAKEFISELAAMEIIQGFPDGNFRPNEPVTRAQFAAMLENAFEKGKIRQAVNFRDISSNYWAYNAIREAYQMGFVNAVPGNKFNPSENLSRIEILAALARGLNYTATGSVDDILSIFTDYSSISGDYRSLIAAATQRGLVVNYPDISALNGDKVATRAEVCALLYRALVSTGEVANISSPYVVGDRDNDIQVSESDSDDDDDDDDDDDRDDDNDNDDDDNDDD
jgi:S-layer homology domain